MGLIRTPRPLYQDGFVMEFYVKEKQVYYKISKWNPDGYSQGELQKGKLGKQEPQVMFNQALQNFSSGSRK